MPDVPRHPNEGPSDAPEPVGEIEPSPGSRRSMYLWWVIGVGAVVLFVVLHLRGVLGPGGH